MARTLGGFGPEQSHAHPAIAESSRRRCCECSPSRANSRVVEIRTDNAVTMAYVNHQGGRNPALTALVRPLWEWALATKTTVFATYIPGK